MKILPALIVVFGLSVVACGSREASAGVDGPAPLAEAGLAIVPVQLSASGRTHVIQAEIAMTVEEQAQGLMFREELAPDRGMLFPMSPARPASFWMKNTLIPLDIIFIRADGTIARIAERTTPRSLEPIDSGEPVAAVLEIAGGRARALGLGPDDRVSWRIP